MSMPLDVNFFAALAIVLPLAGGAYALQTRRRIFQHREYELHEAIDLLRLHTDEMRTLDDDRVPVSLLGLLCSLSKILHDPAVISRTRNVMRDRQVQPAEIAPEVQETIDAVNRDYALLLERHPDLATSFVKALFSCILSFEKRHPECAGQFDLGLPRMVRSPVQEAQRIVRQAGRTNAWDFEPKGAIPA